MPASLSRAAYAAMYGPDGDRAAAGRHRTHHEVEGFPVYGEVKFGGGR